MWQPAVLVITEIGIFYKWNKCFANHCSHTPAILQPRDYLFSLGKPASVPSPLHHSTAGFAAGPSWLSSPPALTADSQLLHHLSHLHNMSEKHLWKNTAPSSAFWHWGVFCGKPLTIYVVGVCTVCHPLCVKEHSQTLTHHFQGVMTEI